MSRESDEITPGQVFKAILIVVVTGLLIASVVMTAYSIYNDWSSQKHGEAEPAQATANRQIKVQEAKATEEASKSLAEAEVIRAEGVARANKIIGDSLKGNEEYLHYLWLHGLEDSKNQIIYIPTEANMPILEAGKRQTQKP